MPTFLSHLPDAAPRSSFWLRLSGDGFGKLIREKLVANHVGLDYAVAAKEQTTMVTVSIDSNGTPSYSFYVNGTADWGWTPAGITKRCCSRENMHATAIQFGCLTMAMGPGNLVIEDWAREHYKQNSVTISHDINMRPALGFERNHERLRVERINDISHIIKASDEDIHWLYDMADGEDVDKVVWKWIGDSARHVFITRGGEGVSVYRLAADGSRTRFDR